MTLREVIQAELDDLSVDVSSITMDRALLDNEVNGNDTYSKAKAETVDTVLFGLLRKLLAMPDVSDSGTSLRWDRSTVQAYLNALSAQYEWVIASDTPTVTDKSYLW